MVEGKSNPGESEVRMEWPASRFPQSKVESDIAEAAVSAELAKLSLEEREKIQFDVHGIAPCQDEDPAFVTSKLTELQKHLDAIPMKPAFEKAMAHNEQYVTDFAFRRWFLRCQRFDPEAAAKLMVMHFSIKERIFGDGEILGRDVLLKDLSDRDRETLETGSLQIFPSRDAAGRTVTGIASEWDETKHTLGNVGRAIWYTMMVTQNDEETQRRGTVLAIFNYGKCKNDVRYIGRLRELMLGLPVKTVGAHYCYQNETLRPFVAGVRRLFLDKSTWFHMREHLGTPKEVAFELQTFGILAHELPMQADESWSVEWHLEWVKTRETIEANDDSTNDTTITVPHRFDVLYGRGIVSREHTGNNRLVHLCEMHIDEYGITSKQRKTAITRHLVSVIHESQGRFLKWVDSGWVEVDDEVARDKISQMFRHLQRKHAKDRLTEDKKANEKRGCTSLLDGASQLCAG